MKQIYIFVTLFDISLILDIVNAVNNITESPVYDTAQDRKSACRERVSVLV